MTSKEKILRAAQELFGEHGYADTTLKKIAEKAGVAFGLTAHYYGSKEKLFVRSSTGIIDEVQRRLAVRLVETENGLDATMAFIDCYLNCSVDPELNFKILVQCSPYTDVKSTVKKQDVVNKFEELIVQLSDCIRKGVEDGSINDAVVPIDTANTIFATIVGSVRTMLLAPYCPEDFYGTVMEFIRRSIAK